MSVLLSRNQSQMEYSNPNVLKIVKSLSCFNQKEKPLTIFTPNKLEQECDILQNIGKEENADIQILKSNSSSQMPIKEEIPANEQNQSGILCRTLSLIVQPELNLLVHELPEQEYQSQSIQVPSHIIETSQANEGIIQLLEVQLHEIQQNNIFNKGKGLSKKHKKRIVKMKVGNTNKDCAICQCDLIPKEVVMRLPCRHVYHQGCLSNWLQVSKNCPMCRLDLQQHFIDEDFTKKIMLQKPHTMCEQILL